MMIWWCKWCCMVTMKQWLWGAAWWCMNWGAAVLHGVLAQYVHNDCCGSVWSTTFCRYLTVVQCGTQCFGFEWFEVRCGSMCDTTYCQFYCGSVWHTVFLSQMYVAVVWCGAQHIVNHEKLWWWNVRAKIVEVGERLMTNDRMMWWRIGVGAVPKRKFCWRKLHLRWCFRNGSCWRYSSA